MKINFITPHLKLSGGVKILLTYADMLVKRGHEVRIILQSKNLLKKFLANSLGAGKPEWFKNFKPQIIRVSNISDSEDIPTADITLVTSHKHAHYLLGYPGYVGHKFYLIQHDEGLHHGDREAVNETYRMSLKQIVVSTWLKEIMEERFGKKAHFLLNPIDRKQFRPLDREYDKDSLRILLLDHNYEWKGTKEGVKIVNRLKNKYSNLKLILFGVRREKPPYDYDEYYYDLPQEKLAWLYSNSDIYLCPSWDEGSGLPAMEAMACKCAVVTYDNGGSRDYAFDNQTALVAKSKNQNQLEEKLEILIKNKADREEISKNGYNQIMSMPTWDEQTDRLGNIFKNV